MLMNCIVPGAASRVTVLPARRRVAFQYTASRCVERWDLFIRQLTGKQDAIYFNSEKQVVE